MSEESIKIVLREIILDIVQRDISDISDDENLHLLGINSIDQVRIIIEFEERFGIEIGDDDYDEKNYTSISSICGVVRKYI